MKSITSYILLSLLIFYACDSSPSKQEIDANFSSVITLKTPGNPAISYPLSQTVARDMVNLDAEEDIPVTISKRVTDRVRVTITAQEDVYFNFKQVLNSGFNHDESLFYMPGFWYRKNLRSPHNAPSFHTSDSWTVREDRLSAPLTGIYNETTGEYLSVMRIDDFEHEALTTHKNGEVIVSGETSIGYTGFENISGEASLSFGFPYQETPKSYIRKLTLADPIEAFQLLKEGETIELVWEIKTGEAQDYSDFIKQMWEYSYDTYTPAIVNTDFSDDFVKETITHYFTDSYVDEHPLKFTSGEGMLTHIAEPNGRAEVGFVGRVLLNAFNALEYGEANDRNDLVNNSNAIFDSYLEHGFTPQGFIREYVNFDNGTETDVLSIRRQSEGIYALLHYLQYEKNNGREHPEWEEKLIIILDKFLEVQNEDGSFPRKFRDNMSLEDSTGGSTPSATVPLVLAYKYFGDESYLESAKRSADYLDKEIISNADYFSSTLDANCEDKEASLYASTATYYLALITDGEERQHYADLSLKSAYFALSWYYLWDVPFAPGQMIGDIGLKTRGWGNVSVENNHIDVFIFEFGSVLEWLGDYYDEPRFSEFLDVISSSMRQLLPFEGHLCGIAKTGYYTEVVQHTNWDYGRNGKGFYNNYFAPGWTVASLWELLSPGRAEEFLLN